MLAAMYKQIVVETAALSGERERQKFQSISRGTRLEINEKKICEIKWQVEITSGYSGIIDGEYFWPRLVENRGDKIRDNL